MIHWVRRVCLISLLAVVGCSQSAPAGQAPTSGQLSAAASRPESRKTLTISASNTILGFGFQSAGTTGGGARSLIELHSNGLVTTDAKGQLEGRLAAKLPSFDDGTISVLPDGRLQTVWTLRPNVKWQDGAPFTADDVVLGWKVTTNPEFPVLGTTNVRQIDRVEARDAQTAVITWKTTFYQARAVGLSDLWPLPQHLIGAQFEAGDLDAFLNLPYWTTEYVHLGPFRVSDFGFGENVVLDRFDDYFLGRPKLSQVTIKIIPDANTLFSNLLANAVDIVTEQAIPVELSVRLRDQWRNDGGGTVVQREGNWFFINLQFNPEWGKVPEIRDSVAARRGLLLAIDRDAIREAMLPGFPGTEPDTFMPASDPRAPLVGKPFERYRYDPNRALQELASVGWTRDSGGRMHNQAGQQVSVPIRATTASAKEMSIVAQAWRELGIEVSEEPVPGPLTSVREYRAQFPATEITAQNNGDAILARFDGRLRPSPPRWSGNQGGWYANPAMDSLIDKLNASLDQREQGLVLKDIGELMANDLPCLPLYFGQNLAGVRKGIRALTDDFSGAYLGGPGIISRNAYLWDRD